MADFQTGAGATLGLSASQPGTYNQAGYEALSFTDVGKITAFGDVPSRVYQEVTVMYLASEGTDVAKGGFDLGSQQLTIVIDPDDAGQAMLDTATNSRNPYSVKLDHPALGTIYAQALVMGGTRTYGDNNTAATRQVTLRYKMASVSSDGVVTVDA